MRAACRRRGYNITFDSRGRHTGVDFNITGVGNVLKITYTYNGNIVIETEDKLIGDSCIVEKEASYTYGVNGLLSSVWDKGNVSKIMRRYQRYLANGDSDGSETYNHITLLYQEAISLPAPNDIILPVCDPFVKNASNYLGL